jgi:hypothetical protein
MSVEENCTGHLSQHFANLIIMVAIIIIIFFSAEV